MTFRSSTGSGGRSHFLFGWLGVGLGVAILGAPACRNVPLLAPSGSAITLQSPATALSTDSFPIVALVFEGITATSGTGNGGNTNNTTTAGGGQPVHNGTHVTFSTNIGTITPSDQTTVSGRATVTFTGDGRVGTVTITATSGDIVKTATITLAAPSAPGGGN